MTLVPVILGSDKTIASIGMGHVEYYPLYLSIGNLHNGARRAHARGVVVIGFLAIPTCELYNLNPEFSMSWIHCYIFTIFPWPLGEKKDENTKEFRDFKKRIFHESMAHILRRLKRAMKKPVVMLCADGHYRRVIISLGPYLVDYPEQALLTGIVQGWCPK